MNKLLLTLLLTLTALLTACSGGGGGGGNGTSLSRVDYFINLLHSRYGYITNNNFVVVKQPSQTLTEGFVVVYDWDLHQYVAYDLQNYHSGDSWSTYTYNTDYEPVSIHDSYIGAYGETFYIGDAYDFLGFYQGEFVFEENGEGSKDLEKVAALMETFKVEKMGEAMSQEFGLSEARGIEIAKLASQMQKLSKKRALTEQDAKSFSNEVLGVDLSKAEQALKSKAEGDSSEFDALLETAAKTNEVSPEHMNKIINELFLRG